MHEMDDEKWFRFFRTCAETIAVKSAPAYLPVEGGSWCSWTTFDRLVGTAGYWAGPLPTSGELKESFLGHGSNWSQYFHYSQLCHFIVPRKFVWERVEAGHFESGDVNQDIDGVAEILRALQVPHRLTPLVLEIKSY